MMMAFGKPAGFTWSANVVESIDRALPGFLWPLCWGRDIVSVIPGRARPPTFIDRLHQCVPLRGVLLDAVCDLVWVRFRLIVQAGICHDHR